ncbi:MAG: acyl-CoA thioesterase [Lysinibacillus sp.]
MISYEFTVRWGDTDAAGIVFFPNFYKWMDEASHELLRKTGKSSWALFNEEHKSIPLLEAHCQFYKPLLFEDHVTIETTVEHIANKTFKLIHTFKRQNEVVAQGYTVRAWTSFLGKPKAIPIPDDVRQNFEQLMVKGELVNDYKG